MGGVGTVGAMDTPCDLWTGYTNADGYGVQHVGGQVRYTHTLAWEAVNGPVPDGLQLDHLCRVRACRAVAHLEPVTSQVNTLRGEGVAALNARKVACPQGHPYTPENTRMTPRGQRMCRTCRRAQNSARKSRLRAEWLAAGVPRRY